MESTFLPNTQTNCEFRYIILQPVLRILTKSSASAIQSVLHVLFLPTPFKMLSHVSKSTGETKEGNRTSSVELLKPGALYSDCAVVHLKMKPPEPRPSAKEKGKGSDVQDNDELSLPDDGELGGELAGRLVWEAFEEALKTWELENPPKEKVDNSEGSTPGLSDNPTVGAT
jgi:hypothetical protein